MCVCVGVCVYMYICKYIYVNLCTHKCLYMYCVSYFCVHMCVMMRTIFTAVCIITSTTNICANRFHGLFSKMYHSISNCDNHYNPF